jgi:hypothetical protein
MKEDPEMSSLVDALRADLPSERDAERVRARLAAAGVAVGAALMTDVAAGSAAVKVATSTGIVADLSARFAALSWASKAGVIAVVSASTVGTPVLVAKYSDAPSRTKSTQVVQARAAAPKVAPRSAAPETQAFALPTETAEVPSTVAPAETARRVSALPKPAVTIPIEPELPSAAPPSSQPSNTSSNQEAIKAFPEVENPASAPNAPQAAVPSTLSAETLLIDGALAALRAGDLVMAQRFVDEHARRFPNGLLFRERERARTKLQAARAADQNP